MSPSLTPALQRRMALIKTPSKSSGEKLMCLWSCRPNERRRATERQSSPSKSQAIKRRGDAPNAALFLLTKPDVHVLLDKHRGAEAFCLLAERDLRVLPALRMGSTAFPLLAEFDPRVLLTLRKEYLSALNNSAPSESRKPVYRYIDIP